RSRCHNFLPVSASKQNTTRRCSPAFFPSPLPSPPRGEGKGEGAIAVQNTRPAATTGEPMPSPSSADQRTFLVREKCNGIGFFDDDTPLQFGPRNCGQSSAGSRPVSNKSRTAAVSASRPAQMNRIRELLEGGKRPDLSFSHFGGEEERATTLHWTRG